MNTTNLLLWIHIVALVAGGSNTVVMPIIGATLPKVDEQTVRRCLLASHGGRSRSSATDSGPPALAGIWLPGNAVVLGEDGVDGGHVCGDNI
jgi:hypothetical protein